MLVALWLVACGTEVPTPSAPADLGDAIPEKGRENPDRELGFEGMGDVRFGMDRNEVEQALGHPLHGNSEGEGCTVLTPKPEGSVLSLMFEEGKLRRIDADSPKIEVEGGGRVGMSAEEIRKLYPGVKEQPHKYVEGALYLIVDPPAVGDGKIVFETDAHGKVTTLRAGLSPQVEYVEGCG